MGLSSWIIQVGPVKSQGPLIVEEEGRRKSEGYTSAEVGQNNMLWEGLDLPSLVLKMEDHEQRI